MQHAFAITLALVKLVYSSTFIALNFLTMSIIVINYLIVFIKHFQSCFILALMQYEMLLVRYTKKGGGEMHTIGIKRKTFSLKL